MLENLSSQGVLAVKRIHICRNNELVQTNTFNLTFCKPLLPDFIKAGYLEGHCRRKKTIPNTSAVPKRLNKTWFSDICKAAIKQRNGALERFKREPAEGNLNAYRIARAKARRDVRLSKQTSWRNYIFKLNSQASVKSVWNRIQKIKGKESSNYTHHLSVNDRDVTSHRDIANALTDRFSPL